jgi:hypothetical protein
MREDRVREDIDKVFHVSELKRSSLNDLVIHKDISPKCYPGKALLFIILRLREKLHLWRPVVQILIS